MQIEEKIHPTFNSWVNSNKSQLYSPPEGTSLFFLGICSLTSNLGFIGMDTESPYLRQYHFSFIMYRNLEHTLFP
jgi:hypothetical protein